jgi:UrcA family protein
MYTKSAGMSAWAVLGAAAVTCTLFAGNVSAASPEFTVAVQVSTRGLDLSQPAGAHELYQRLQYAAWEVCKPDVRVALEPVADPKSCAEKALGDAIRSAKQPLLTQIYLETHTLREAATHGIEVPEQTAAK